MSDLPPFQNLPRESSAPTQQLATKAVTKVNSSDLENFNRAINAKLSTENTSQEAPEQNNQHQNSNNLVNNLINLQYANLSTQRAYENVKKRQDHEKNQEQEDKRYRKEEESKDKKRQDKEDKGVGEAVKNGVERICKKAKSLAQSKMSRRRLRL